MPKPTNHDAYIAQAADFAVPILEKIRATVHEVCPGVQETIKWGKAHYEHEGMLVAVSAHKAHVNFGFWRGTELSDPDGILEIVGKTKIGNLRLERLTDLPAKRLLVKYLREAVRLNEAELTHLAVDRVGLPGSSQADLRLEIGTPRRDSGCTLPVPQS